MDNDEHYNTKNYPNNIPQTSLLILFLFFSGFKIYFIQIVAQYILEIYYSQYFYNNHLTNLLQPFVVFLYHL